MSQAEGPSDAAALQELLLAIAQTAAPTGAEEERAALVAGLWAGAGLEVRRDAVGNVLAEVPTPGSGPAGPKVVVAAHLDSVFGPEVDVSVRREAGRWSGPGIGDNAASLAILTRYLATRSGRRRPPLLVAATVGEEGLGDLRGARHLVEGAGRGTAAFIAFDGVLGTITDEAVGSRRYEARFRAPGGHSWGDYGEPSAVHAAGAAIAALARLPVPRSPRSSLNVGQVWGGTSINAIAERAGFNLDLRSVSEGALANLDAAAKHAVMQAAQREGMTIELELVGDRPAGKSDDGRLVAAAQAAYAAVGVPAQTSAGSTDANPAMAAGIPAIAFGGYRGGNAHRLDEWLDPDSLVIGLAAFAELLARLA